MPRLMSVALTEQAVRDRRKTVTRRAGWSWLTPGTDLELCRKVMGRRAGEPLERIALVRVTDVSRQQLSEITEDDVAREGFTPTELAPWMSGDGIAAAFVRFFTEHMGGTPDQEVTRVEWRYLS